MCKFAQRLLVAVICIAMVLPNGFIVHGAATDDLPGVVTMEYEVSNETESAQEYPEVDPPVVEYPEEEPPKDEYHEQEPLVTIPDSVITLPYFMDYAVFDILDLRGIVIEVDVDDAPEILIYSDITHDMISWAYDRDLNYTADFIADQTLDTTYRTLIITPFEGSQVMLDLPVRRYAFDDGEYFVLRLASQNPVNGGVGELRRMEAATNVQHQVFANITTDPLLGPDGKFPPTLNNNALFGFVHNRGEQVGYGIMSISRNRLIDSAIDNPGWAVNVWADRDVQQDAANDRLLWRVVRLPNGYYSVLYVYNDQSVVAFGGPRAMRIGALNQNIPMPRIDISNPDWWHDSNLWFELESGVPHDVAASLVSIGDIELVDDDVAVFSSLLAGTISFDIPGNPVAIENVPLQWYRGQAETGPWTAIYGATSPVYIIQENDDGYWLRVGAHPAEPYILGSPVFSAAVGPVQPRPEFIVHSADIVSIRMIEMGWIDIRWRNRMAFDTTISHDQNPIRRPENFRLTIDGEEVGIEIAMYYEFPIANPHTFMSSIRVEDWQYWWDKFKINQFNHPGSSTPLFYDWLNYDINNDPLGIFEWCDNDGMFTFTGQNVPFGMQLQVLAPLPLHAAAGGGTISTMDVVYDVLYTPYYQFIAPVYSSVSHPDSPYSDIYIRIAGTMSRTNALANAERARIMLTHTLYYDDVQSDFLNGIITQSLQRHGFNKILTGSGENAVFTPEFRGRTFGSSPAAGYGGRNNFTNAAGGMMSVNVFNHEVGHAVDGFAIMYLADNATDPEIREFFNDIRRRLAFYFAEVQEQNWFNPGFGGTFRNNRGEMFAGLFEVWFNTRGQNNAQPTGRLALEVYHPEFYQLASSFLISEDFPHIPGWNRPTPSTFRGQRSPRVFVPNRGAAHDLTTIRYQFGSMWAVEPTAVGQLGIPTAFNSPAHRAPTPGARPYSGGQYFKILDSVRYQWWTGSMYGAQLNTWFDWSSGTAAPMRGTFLVTPQQFSMPDGSYKIVYSITASGDDFGSDGGPFDHRFGNDHHALPGVFAHADGTGRHYGGSSFGIVSPCLVDVPEPRPVVRGMPYNPADPYQLWYFVGIQGRYMQIANLGMSLRGYQMVISTRYGTAPWSGGTYYLEPWQMNPEPGAVKQIVQLRPTPAPAAQNTRLTHFRYNVIPNVRYDVIMEDVWIDSNDNVIWIRWTEAVHDTAMAGNIDNFRVVQAGEHIELSQDGSFTAGNITRLQLAEPAVAPILGGAGLNIQFTASANSVSGLPLNNQRTFNFRGENWPAPSTEWDTLDARVAYAQGLLNLPTEVSEDGLDVHYTVYWVDRATMDALLNAVATGRTTLRPALTAPAVTTADIDNAISALNAAISQFMAARVLGGTEPGVGYPELIAKLQELIAYAQDLVDTTYVCEDGTDVLAVDFWVTQDVMDEIVNAIAAAEDIIDTPPSATVIQEAINDLQEAIDLVMDESRWGQEKITFLPPGSLGGVIGNTFVRDYDPDARWSFYHSIVTEHFIIFWENTGSWVNGGPSNAPYTGVDATNRFLPMDEIAEAHDRIFEFIRDDIGWANPERANPRRGEPDNRHRWDTHRMISFIDYRNAWHASGGTTGSGDNRIGTIWQSLVPSRPARYWPGSVTTIEPFRFPTFVHEIGHAFQAMSRIEYPINVNNNTPGAPGVGSLGEIQSQHKVWQMYAGWFYMEHHGQLFMNNTHRGFLHPTVQWSAPMLFEYWTYLHGSTIAGRLNRQGVTGLQQDVVAAYIRYTEITQEEFNDQVFDASRRFVTWDLPRVRETNAPFANSDQFATALTTDGRSDWYRISPLRAPNSYGFNAIRLDVPPSGTVVNLEFQGLGYPYFAITAARSQLAGWRYGFVAMTSDGTRVYGPMNSASYANPDGNTNFTVPANTEYLWLVVTGAPTQHWNGAVGHGTENWGYEIRLDNAEFHNTVSITFVGTDFTMLDHSIAAAQARVEANYLPDRWAVLQAALTAALEVRALDADALQADVDVANSVLVIALFGLTGINSDDVAYALSVPGAINAENGNLARVEHGGTLTLSHVHGWGANNQAFHDSQAAVLRNGVLTSGHWHTHNAQNTNPELFNNDPTDRHTLTMTWPHPVTIDSTRILWWNDAVAGATTGVAPPGADTFVEYWDGSAWVRINIIINDVGVGTGILGNISNGLNFTNTRWNGVFFEPVTTTAFRINTARAPGVGMDAGIGATQWEIFGVIADIPCPVPGFDIFNNGEGGSPSRPNSDLAEAGIIRMWTQLDGEGAPVYLAAADTITALDQNGDCAIEFVHVNRIWSDDDGWLNYFTSIDVDKNEPWQYINFTITIYGQTVELLLVNSLFIVIPMPVPSFDIFNNGEGGSPSRPNADLAEAGIIRMWTQLDGEGAPVYLVAADTITALDQNGDCAIEFVRVGRVWSDDTGWSDYFNLIDVDKNQPWQYINFSITVYGQTVELFLVNSNYIPPGTGLRYDRFEFPGQKTLLLPALIWDVRNEDPNNYWYIAGYALYNDFTCPTYPYNIYNMVLTEHFAIFWENTGSWANGRGPSYGTGNRHIPMDQVVIAVDEMFEFIRDDLGFAEPGASHDWDNYRMVIFLRYNAGGAFGGGATHRDYAGVPITSIGMLWQNAGATRPDTQGRIPTLLHEIGHSFQYMLRSDGYWAFATNPPDSRGQVIWEITSQHKLSQFYPGWGTTFQAHHKTSFMGDSHRGFLHEAQRYRAPWVPEYWAQLHGRDIMGRLWRGVQQGEDIIMAYQRMFDMTQAEFNREIFDASSRFVTWDLDSIRDVAAPNANRHPSAFTTDGEWYRVATNRAPQNYGYNAIRLNVPAAGAVIELDFRGIAGHTDFRQHKVNLAGWHYGFLAMLTDGTRVYGDMFSATYANPEGQGQFTVPENTAYLWLVVTGAPTEHFEHLWFIPYSPVYGTYYAEQWPYEIRLTGAELHSSVGVTLTGVRWGTLDAAIQTAQARVEANYCPVSWANMQTALTDAIAVRSNAYATQEDADDAASNLIIALFALIGIDSSDAEYILSAQEMRDNLARVEHGGTLTLSHIQGWGTGTSATAQAVHDAMAASLRNGIVLPPNSNSNNHRWHTHNSPAAAGGFNNDPTARHTITMEWTYPVLINGTRIMWWNDVLEGVTTNVPPPGPDTFVEWWDDVNETWVRIDLMLNDVGRGIGVLGNRVNGVYHNNTRWNGVLFEPVVTTKFRVSTHRGLGVTATDTGLGASQWEIFGHAISENEVIVFDLNGGTYNSSNIISHGVTPGIEIGYSNVPAPTHNNYTFMGWRYYGQAADTPNLTSAEVAAWVVTASRTFIAQWRQESVVLVSATTSPRDFISVVEASPNIWTITFNVTKTWSDGTTEVVEYSVNARSINANLMGQYVFGVNHPLHGFVLVFDMRVNGSNIRTFGLIRRP